MPIFSFEARNASGRAQRGTQEAPSAAALASTLRGRGWLVLDVRAAEDAGVSGLAALNPLQWLPVRSIDVEQSLQQLAIMLRSGLTLLSSLQTVGEQANRPAMRRVWIGVGQRIQQGSSLAEAMVQQYPGFGHMIIQLVRVGEQTGTLDQVLTRAAEALERGRLMRTQLLTAMT